MNLDRPRLGSPREKRYQRAFGFAQEQGAAGKECLRDEPGASRRSAIGAGCLSASSFVVGLPGLEPGTSEL